MKGDVHVHPRVGQLYETGEVRSPRKDEWYLDYSSKAIQATADHRMSLDGQIILTPEKPQTIFDASVFGSVGIGKTTEPERHPRKPAPGERTFAAGDPVTVTTVNGLRPATVASVADVLRSGEWIGTEIDATLVPYRLADPYYGRRYWCGPSCSVLAAPPLACTCAWSESCPHGIIRENAQGWASPPEPQAGARTLEDRQRKHLTSIADRRDLRYRPVREPRRWPVGLVGYDGEGW